MFTNLQQNGDELTKRLLWKDTDPSTSKGGSGEAPPKEKIEKPPVKSDSEKKEGAPKQLSADTRVRVRRTLKHVDLVGELGESLSPKQIANDMSKVLQDDEAWLRDRYESMYPDLVESPISQEDREEIIELEHERLEEVMPDHMERMKERLQQYQRPSYESAVRKIMHGAFSRVDQGTEEIFGRLDLSDDFGTKLLSAQQELKQVKEDIRAENIRLTDYKRRQTALEAERSKRVFGIRDKWQQMVPDMTKSVLGKSLKYSLIGLAGSAVLGLGSGFIGTGATVAGAASSLWGMTSGFATGLWSAIGSGATAINMTVGGAAGMLGLGALTNRTAVRPSLVKVGEQLFNQKARTLQKEMEATEHSQRLTELEEREQELQEKIDAYKPIIAARIKELKTERQKYQKEASRIAPLIPKEVLEDEEISADVQELMDLHELNVSQTLSLDSMIETLERIMSNTDIPRGITNQEDLSLLINRHWKEEEENKARQEWHGEAEADLKKPQDEAAKIYEEGDDALQNYAAKITDEQALEELAGFFDPDTKSPSISTKSMKLIENQSPRLFELVENMQSMHKSSALRRELRESLHPVLQQALRSEPETQADTLVKTIVEKGKMKGLSANLTPLWKYMSKKKGLTGLAKPYKRQRVRADLWIAQWTVDELYRAIVVLEKLSADDAAELQNGKIKPGVDVKEEAEKKAEEEKQVAEDRAELAELKEQMEEKDKLIAEKDEAMAEKAREIETKTSRIEELDRDIAAAAGDRARIAELSLERDGVIAERDGLEVVMESLEEEMDRLKKRFELVNERRKKHFADLQKIRDEFGITSKQVDIMIRHLNTLKDEVPQATQDALNELRRDLGTATTRVTALEAEVAEKERQRVALDTELTLAKNERDEANRLLSDKTNEADALEILKNELEEELRLERESHTTTSEESAQKTTRIEVLEEKLRVSEEQKHLAEAEKAELKKQLEEAEKKIVALDGEVTDLKSKINAESSEIVEKYKGLVNPIVTLTHLRQRLIITTLKAQEDQEKLASGLLNSQRNKSVPLEQSKDHSEYQKTSTLRQKDTNRTLLQVESIYWRLPSELRKEAIKLIKKHKKYADFEPIKRWKVPEMPKEKSEKAKKKKK